MSDSLKEKEMGKVPTKPVLEILEEDDEFEEFGSNIGKTNTNLHVANKGTNSNLKGKKEIGSGAGEPQWEDDWDDDNTDDQFTAKLREELKKRK